ncbi:MAG: hypothetical protein SF053_16505 [Bacteroidia bacterium]|nr:hypothetical protein [Bacteroidia bacterium]
MKNSKLVLGLMFGFLSCSVSLGQHLTSCKDTVWITVAYEPQGYISGSFSHEKPSPVMLIPYHDQQKITTLNYADSIFIVNIADFPSLNRLPMYCLDFPVKDGSSDFQALVGEGNTFQMYRKRLKPFEKKPTVYGYHHQPLVIAYIIFSVRVVLVRLDHAPLSILNIDKKVASDPFVVEYRPHYFLVEEILAVRR